MTTNSTKASDAEKIQIIPKEKSFKWMLIALAIFALCLLALYFMNFHGSWGNQGDFGAFGDYFGGVLNPILSFATVGLLIWSLKYQVDELALTREELAETKEETALSRQALEAQVAQLKQDGKLTELHSVVKAQLEIIQNLLTTKVFQTTGLGPSLDINFEMILNQDYIVKREMVFIHQQFESDESNSIQIVGKSLEIQISQLGHISLEYARETNSKLYALPYLVNAISLLNKFYKFQPNESMEILLSEINAEIIKGKHHVPSF